MFRRNLQQKRWAILGFAIIVAGVSGLVLAPLPWLALLAIYGIDGAPIGIVKVLLATAILGIVLGMLPCCVIYRYFGNKKAAIEILLLWPIINLVLSLLVVRYW